MGNQAAVAMNEPEQVEELDVSPTVGEYDTRLNSVSTSLDELVSTRSSDTAALATVKTINTLCEFFTKDADDKNNNPEAFDPTKPETHRRCKLVYILEDTATGTGNQQPAFQDVKGNDTIVLATLAQFCMETRGAMELYLCKTRYHSIGYTQEMFACPDVSRLRQELVVLSPWLSHDGATPIHVSGVNAWHSVMAEVEDEVVPCGLFECKDFAFDDTTGTKATTLEKWHAAMALVVVPIQVRAQLQFAGGVPSMLDHWCTLVDSHPALAIAAMTAIGEVPRAWSLDSVHGRRALHGIQKLQSLEALSGLLQSCKDIAFEPEMHTAVAGFATDALVSLIRGLLSDRYIMGCNIHRNRVNLVASLLHGETCVARIGSVLDAVPLKPYWRFERDLATDASDPFPAEYARVIYLALMVSVERATQMVETEYGEYVIHVVVPAMLLLIESLSGQSMEANAGGNVVEMARVVYTQLQTVMPEVRNMPYRWYLSRGCPKSRACECRVVVDEFIKSTVVSTEFEKPAFDAHYRDRLEALRVLDKVTVQAVADAETERVLVTKIYEDALYQEALEHAKALEAVVMAV